MGHLFFVLSGFLIDASSFGSLKEKISVADPILQSAVVAHFAELLLHHCTAHCILLRLQY